MPEPFESRSTTERGFTLIELLVVVLIIGLLAAIAVPAYQGSIRKARIIALAADAKNLHRALVRYHIDQSSYPPEVGPGALSTTSLEPLPSLGYYTQAPGFLSRVQGNKLAFYFAPDVGGTDTQFLTFVRHIEDSTILMMIADTSVWGSYLEGVYIFEGGGWVRVDEVSG